MRKKEIKRPGKSIAWGTGTALCVLLAGAAVLAALISAEKAAEESIGGVALLIETISAFTGGFTAGRKMREGTLLIGIIVGVILCLLRVIVGAAISAEQFAKFLVRDAAILTGAATAGGIAATGRRKRRRA